jgi:hypothetical protein
VRAWGWAAGRTNEVTRDGLGRYVVRLPGIGGDSGVPKVTAYGPNAHTCNVTSWHRDANQPDDELVLVACHSAAGNLADGALNTVSRSAPGTYQVRLRGLFVAAGDAQYVMSYVV